MPLKLAMRFDRPKKAVMAAMSQMSSSEKPCACRGGKSASSISCERSHEIDDRDFGPLHAHGFDDEDIWDIAAITAFFGLSNRLASFSGMQPNPEFFLMGRLPREKK